MSATTMSAKVPESDSSFLKAGLAVEQLLAVMAALLLGAGLAWGLSDLWVVLHQQWTESSDYSHGYLMLVMALWLVIRHWRANPPRELAPDIRWLLPMAGLLAILVLLELLFLNIPRLFLLPPLLIAATGVVFGRYAVHHFMWPALLLYFAVPGWILLAVVMQPVTTWIVTGMLGITSIPAYIEESFVNLPIGTFHIADGCAGVNYLVTGMGLAAFYGLAFYDRWRDRLLLLGVAMGMSLVSNWLRVYSIIMAGYLTDMQHYLVAVDHLAFGWVVFAVMMVPVLLTARAIDRRPAESIRSPSAIEQTERGPLAHPRAWHSLLAAIVVSAGLILVPMAVSRVVEGDARSSVPLPYQLADGSIRQAATLAWQPVFDGAVVERVSYAGGEGIIDVYRGFFPRQSMDERLIRYHHTFGGYRWRPVEQGVRQVLLHGREYPVIEYRGYISNQETVVWAWYEVGGRRATSTLGVKTNELMALSDQRRDAEAIAIASSCWPDCDHAASKMLRFLKQNGTSLGWLLAEGPSP
jgi:exosortase